MATKQIAWQTGSGNITLTYTGQGDGTISVQSDENDGIARSQVITIKTSAGSTVVTKNLTISQAACPIPVGTVLNYSYTGSYQEVILPAGQYKLQCWGAQGGSNAAASSYGITAQAGGKGGYSEGIITLSQKTAVRVYVGGKGSSSAGGFNGGGSTTGTSQYNASNEFGYSKMGGGGGSTDIRLSNGSLYSRMIVAGGGSGGSMCYRSVTSTQTTWENVATISGDSGTINGYSYTKTSFIYSGLYYIRYNFEAGQNPFSNNDVIRFTLSKSFTGCRIAFFGGSSPAQIDLVPLATSSPIQFTYKTQQSPYYLVIQIDNSGSYWNGSITVDKQVTETVTTTDTDGHAGYAGGGSTGDGYSNNAKGKQNAAGTPGGSFGQGANQNISTYRYCSGAGGGGWYGGGYNAGNSYLQENYYGSGGGSGWVNTAASAGNRPSGYSGLQLDSGTTYDGNTSFVAPGGGNETGHAGNGYARITRIS